jgi:hypothetical protein
MQEKISRRSFVKDVAKTAGMLYVASQVGRYLDAAYRLLPKNVDEEIARVGGDVIPTVNAHSGEVIPLKPLLVIPQSSEVGYVSVDGLKRTKLGEEKEKAGYVIQNEYDGAVEIPFVGSKFSVPYKGQAFFRGGYDADTSRIYLLYDWISEKKERKGDVINAYFDTKHDAGGKIQKDDVGLIVRISKQGKKESLFAYGGMNTEYGFPDNWVLSPTTINWSCGLGTTPHYTDKHMVFKLDAPLTMVNPERTEMEGMQLYVGNFLTNEWLTVLAMVLVLPLGMTLFYLRISLMLVKKSTSALL